MSLSRAASPRRASRRSRPGRAAASAFPRIKTLDFFCGAGGLTRGLLDAKIEVLAGIDNDERLRRTYECNNAPSRFACEDIREVDIVALRNQVGIRPGDVVLYAACTPCQPFSTLNQRRGKDDRKELLLVFGEIVRRCPPDFVLVENVPGLKNAYGREIYRDFVKMLTDAGLVHSDGDLLDAQHYRVPQVRKRFLMVASRHGPVSLPRPAPAPAPTVRTAIGSFPPAAVGLAKARSRSAPTATTLDGKGAEPPLPNHVARRLSDAHLRIVRAVPGDGGSRGDIKDDSVLLECHRRTPKLHRDVFGRMSWDAPAPTLTCRCTDVYCGRFVHPEQDRGLTLREAAALQTFRDDYVFHGTFFHAAAQIGNAVPVRLARRLGLVIVASARRMRASPRTRRRSRG